MKRYNKELEELIKSNEIIEAIGGYFTFKVDEETRRKVIEALIQQAEIQPQQIEEL